VEEFRRVLEEEYLGRRLVDGPAPETPAVPIDHIGVHKQKDGLNYVGAAPASGRVSGTTLVALADAAERAGSQRVRLTPQQKLVVLDVHDRKVAALTRDLDALGLQVDPSPWRRSTMACTGIEFCKLAIVETKERAIRLVEELEKRLADVTPDTPISIHLNGCPNSCARTQVADIGLKGQIVTDAEGNQVEGFQVHLGGGLGLDAGFGRKLRGLKVTSDELGDYVERVVRRFTEQREDGERFAQWVLRADEDSLK
jgi:sulfite reductase (ferredoxin)